MQERRSGEEEEKEEEGRRPYKPGAADGGAGLKENQMCDASSSSCETRAIVL